jgi:hypothetical protein
MKHNFNYYKLNNDIIVLENHICKDGVLTLLFNGFGLFDDVRNDTIGVNHMLEHIYASHDNQLYDTNAYTNYHNMGFTISKKSTSSNQDISEEKNMIELIKLLSDKFANTSHINNTNFDNLSKELENEYYFRTNFDRFNTIFKSNTSNDLYLGGRIKTFQNKNLLKILTERHKNMLYSDNISFIINSKVTPNMINALNKYFGKLDSLNLNKTIKNGRKLDANFIYSNNDYLNISFSLPYNINSYISSFYFNNYITNTLGNTNLIYDLNTDGYNFIYTIYNFYSYDQMYQLLRLLNNRSYFTNLSRYNIENYYSLFQHDNNYFNKTYEIALPLFRYNIDLLYDFYSSKINIYPYVKSTIPYFYSLNDLYVMGYDNIFMMNKTDVNNIKYSKHHIEIDFDDDKTGSSIISSVNSNTNINVNNNISHLLYFYIKNKKMHNKIINADPNLETTNSIIKNKNITIKYNYNMKNYLLHQVFRLFMNLKKGKVFNSITMLMNNDSSFTRFISLLNVEYNFIDIKNILAKNELLFTMNLISNYVLYNDVFLPQEVLDYIKTNTQSISLNGYEIDVNVTNKKDIQNIVNKIELEPKGYDLKTELKVIKNKTININTKYNFFIFITTANLDYTSVLWTMKKLGLIYTMVFNKVDNYVLIRAPSIDPTESVKYLKTLCKNHIKCSVISTKSDIQKIDLD